MSTDPQVVRKGVAPKVGGVVITYHPDAAFEERLAAMARQVPTMIVVDNSADEAVRQRLSSMAARVGCDLMESQCNVGIAAALNRAFADFARRDFSWVVAFDQDSTPEAECIEALLQVAEARPRAGVVGSNWRDEGGPDAPVRHLIHGSGCRPWFRRVAADADLDGVAFVITSGSLFRVATWAALGGFREDLFLDLVDTEYCLRAGAAGWGVSVAANAHLRHRRGEKRAVRWCGRTWWPAHVPPLRIRLIVRNRVWLLWHHGWIRWPWALFEITHTAFMFFSAICLEDASPPKVRAFAQGLRDGLRGRVGPPRS